MIASRKNYLAVIQAKDGSFRPCDISKMTGIKPNKIRSWLSRDYKAGLVDRTDAGKYIIIDIELIRKEIEKIDRNTATKGSTWGSTLKPKNAQLCRLHDIQYYSRLPYNINSHLDFLKKQLDDWDRGKDAPGSAHFFKETPLPKLNAMGKFHVAVGKRKAALQMWLNPIYTNSFKIFDQLESVHESAQHSLKWISQEYRLDVALLEARRSGHFAIKIPVKEGWRLSKLGYKMKGGKVWINQDWWIDASYGHELETANELAFGDLLDGMQKVPELEKGVNEILAILKDKGDYKAPESDPGGMYG